MLKVLKRATNRGRSTMWECICECGSTTIASGVHLKNGHTKSCGCYRDNFKKLPDGVAAFNSLFRNYKRRHAFTLNKDKFRQLIKQDYYYCGSPPNQKFKNNDRIKSTHCIYNGLDRVDNNRGYKLDNVVPCCGICNRAKNALTHDAFIEHCKKIASNHNRTNTSH